MEIRRVETEMDHQIYKYKITLKKTQYGLLIIVLKRRLLNSKEDRIWMVGNEEN